MEKIFWIVKRKEPEVVVAEIESFVGRLKALPIEEAEQQIAEKKFREPIVIFDTFAIRPFWRDGKKAPPLPASKSARWTSGH